MPGFWRRILPAKPSESGTVLVLFDDVCVLCCRSVQFLFRHDPEGVLRFASLQGKTARKLAEKSLQISESMKTVVVVVGYGTDRIRVLTRSDAAFEILSRIGGFWRMLSVFRFVPRKIRDGVYDWISRNRYGWFGKTDECLVPPPEMRGRFLE